MEKSDFFLRKKSLNMTRFTWDMLVNLQKRVNFADCLQEVKTTFKAIKK